MAEESKIVVDKNKSAEQYMKEALEFYIIPDFIRKNYPDIIKLIFEAESMDADEREYWLQIMPIMDDEQAKKLMEILTNEKTQLKKIDDQHNAEIAKVQAIDQAAIDKERISRERMEDIKKRESESKQYEIADEEKLLKQLDNL